MCVRRPTKLWLWQTNAWRNDTSVLYARTRRPTPAQAYPAHMHAHTFPRPVDSSANLLLLFMSISSCCYFSVFSSVWIKTFWTPLTAPRTITQVFFFFGVGLPVWDTKHVHTKSEEWVRIQAGKSRTLWRPQKDRRLKLKSRRTWPKLKKKYESNAFQWRGDQGDGECRPTIDY